MYSKAFSQSPARRLAWYKGAARRLRMIMSNRRKLVSENFFCTLSSDILR